MAKRKKTPEIEDYINRYLQNEETQKLFAKSPNSLTTRNRILDGTGRHTAITEPEALAGKLLNRQIRRSIDSLASLMTDKEYTDASNRYSLSEPGMDEYYVKLISMGFLPEKPDKKDKKELNTLATLVGAHYGIMHALENKDITAAMAMVQELSRLNPDDSEMAEEASIGYDYTKLGDNVTAGYIARDFANMAKSVAISKLKPEYRKMIDSEAYKDGRHRAIAVAERYKLHQTKEYQAKKAKK